MPRRKKRVAKGSEFMANKRMFRAQLLEWHPEMPPQPNSFAIRRLKWGLNLVWHLQRAKFLLSRPELMAANSESKIETEKSIKRLEARLEVISRDLVAALTGQEIDFRSGRRFAKSHRFGE